MNNLNRPLIHNHFTYAGFGNPLLDISAVINSSEILDQFNLKPDSQSEVGEDAIHQILESLDRLNCKVRKSPGGCTQNTLRIIQGLVKQPNCCVFFGGLGCDNDGIFLESEVEKCGVVTRYAKHFAYTTGKVAALIHGDKRSLVAHLGAAEVYRNEDFNTPENLKLLEQVMLVYIEGFFITHSLDVTLEAIRLSRSNDVTVAFNISGAYVAEAHPEKLLATVTLADIVIGNDAELKALSRVIGLKAKSLSDLALETFLYLCEKNSRSFSYKLGFMKDLRKVLVITQGKDSIYCVYGDNNIVEFAVPHLDPKLIKDTTGAGDSFAAGFLVALFQGKPMTECLAYGCAIAQKVIQQIGVFLPND